MSNYDYSAFYESEHCDQLAWSQGRLAFFDSAILGRNDVKRNPYLPRDQWFSYVSWVRGYEFSELIATNK